MESDAEDGDVKVMMHKARVAAQDKSLAKRRCKLARFAAKTFSVAGNELHVLGHIVGSDRLDGVSPWSHGSDETVAVSILLRIVSQLLSGSVDLSLDGRVYAAGTLARQIVEVEYLAWAFETRNRDGERWLRSDRHQRESFFTPAKLRKAAEGKFRTKDYGYHCELGGHPVPGGNLLLNDPPGMGQFLLADVLGHVGATWDHLAGWAVKSPHGSPILSRKSEMLERFLSWKSVDFLAHLPPPP